MNKKVFIPKNYFYSIENKIDLFVKTDNDFKSIQGY